MFTRILSDGLSKIVSEAGGNGQRRIGPRCGPLHSIDKQSWRRGWSVDILKIRTLSIKGGAASRSAAMIRAVGEYDPFPRAPDVSAD